MGFKANEELKQGNALKGESLPKLEPAIYEGAVITAVDLASRSIGNDETVPALNLTIKAKTGDLHVNQDNAPDENDDTKQMNFFEKYLHLASAILSEEELEQFKNAEIDTFEELVTYIDDAFKPHYNKTKIDLKIIASVYGGNTSTRIPNFSHKYKVPFAKKHGDKSIGLKFSKSELADLAEYKKKISGDADSASSDIGGGDIDTSNQPDF